MHISNRQDGLASLQQMLQMLSEGKEPRATPLRALPSSHRAQIQQTKPPRDGQVQGPPKEPSQEQMQTGPDKPQHIRKGPSRRHLPTASVQGAQATTRLQTSTPAAELKEQVRALG